MRILYMSSASNLGYGKLSPLSGVNRNYVNVGSTNNPYHFGSNQLSGGKAFKRKIKNITKKYRMKSKRNLRSLKNRVRARYSRALALAKSKTGGRKRALSRSRYLRRSRSQRGGGYSQYQNNLPMTPTYSLGGTLAPKFSAEASPPPYKVLSNCTNCADNYNHLTGKGTPSAGH